VKIENDNSSIFDFSSFFKLDIFFNLANALLHSLKLPFSKPANEISLYTSFEPISFSNWTNLSEVFKAEG